MLLRILCPILIRWIQEVNIRSECFERKFENALTIKLEIYARKVKISKIYALLHIVNFILKTDDVNITIYNFAIWKIEIDENTGHKLLNQLTIQNYQLYSIFGVEWPCSVSYRSKLASTINSNDMKNFILEKMNSCSLGYSNN